MRYILFVSAIILIVICQPVAGQNKDSLLFVASKLPADTHQIKAALGLSAAYLNPEPDSAIFWAKAAIVLSKGIPNGKKWLTNGYNTLGMAHYYRSNYQQAIQAFKNYYEAAKAEKDLVKMGFAKNNQGNIYIELGRYDSTLLLYKEALALRQQAGDSAGIAMSYNNLGYVSKEIGDYDKAIEYMLFALRQFENLNDNNAVAITYNYIGQVHLKKKEPEKSIEYFNKAKAIFTERKDDRNIAIANHSIGNAMLENKNFDSAKAYYSTALHLYREQKDDRQLALINANIAEVYVQQEKHDSAAVYFDKAIDLNLAINNRRSMPSILIAYARSALLNDKTIQAGKLLDSAYTFLQYSPQKTHWRDYHKTRALYYQNTGNPTLALDNMSRFVLYNDSVLNETNVKAIADMEVKYETEKKEQENALQKAELSRKNTIIIAIAMLGLLLSMLGFSYYRRYKLKKEKELQQEVLHQQDLAARAVLQAEENERRRIAADLHDGVGQLMTAARMNLEAMAGELAPLDADKKDKLERIINLVDEGCREVRTVSHNMMPNALLKKGLSSALQDFIQKIDQNVLKVQLYMEGMQERLENEVETVLYRVIQECVNNVIKHSGANLLDISVLREPSHIDVTIEDNGKGFDASLKNEGIGLQNIHARINMLKGSVEYDSAPGKGTVVAIHLPLKSLT